ncbi:aldo-keto reductase family 1 member C15-like [Culicoides brevitarsis]|uniref:aldo-keto reductase family 1 member C15-like n=1 Tax=Culicoides brevitarsis TaxID=469753 RepID=UPI00307BB9EC
MSPKVPLVKLNNGLLMPAIALGTCRAKDSECEQAVKDAIDAGYRHFDTAHIYSNEIPVGKAIRDKIAEGVVTREEIFITTKLWCTFFNTEAVVAACERSLEKLGLGYIDLYLMHTPMSLPLDETQAAFPKNADGTAAMLDLDYLETYKKMQECVDKGLVKSLGVSNFNSEQLKRVYDNARIKPVCNQVECSPNINQKKLLAFCKSLDVVLTAYCPLGCHNWEKKTPKFMYDEKVADIGKKYGKTVAQVALRYLIQLGAVPLPKSSNKTRINENLNVFDFELTPEEMSFMDTFNTGERVCGFRDYVKHKNYPFHIEY